MRIINIISPLAVPTFFAVSGFLFFNKKRDSTDLWKYVWRVFKLYLVWSCIYLPLVLFSYYKKEMLNIRGVADYLQHFVFSGSYYHLWYLPSLIVAIVLTFFVSRKIDNNILFIIATVLFIVGTLVDTYSFISPLLAWKTYKVFFLTTRNGLFFGFPFVAIGKIIADNKHENKHIMMIMSMLAMAFEGYYLSFIVNKEIVNMQMNSLLLVPILLIFTLNLPRKNVKGVLLRKTSTLVFCAHPIAITLIGRYFSGIQGTFFVMLVTIIGSLMIAKLTNRISILNHNKFKSYTQKLA